MKKSSLCLVFFFLFQMTCTTASFASGEAQPASEIIKVIGRFVTDCYNNDIYSAMQYVSRSYSVTYGNRIVDYAKFKLATSEYRNRLSKKYSEYSIGNIEIINSNVQENKATLEVEYAVRMFNLKDSKEEGYKAKRSVSLVKEGGDWKIVEWILKA